MRPSWPCPATHSGYVVDEAGIDVALLKDVRVRRGRVSDFAAERPSATFVADGPSGTFPVTSPTVRHPERALSGVQSLIRTARW